MKLIFLDADGTLFHHEGYIPKSAFIAIQKAQQNGHKVCLCTGRQKAEIYGDLTKINYDGIVAGSGAYTEVHNKILKELSFDDDQLKSILDYTLQKKIPVIFESSLGLKPNIFAMKKVMELHKEQCSSLSSKELEQHGLHAVYTLIQACHNIKHFPVNKISFLESSTSYEEIKHHFKDTFDIVPATFAPFGKQSGEISSKTITKAHGMETLMNYYHIQQKDVIAIGDGFNDLCMFEKAGYSIAMGNAPLEVQKKADYVTSSLEEDGIYTAFHYLNLF